MKKRLAGRVPALNINRPPIQKMAYLTNVEVEDLPPAVKVVAKYLPYTRSGSICQRKAKHLTSNGEASFTLLQWSIHLILLSMPSEFQAETIFQGNLRYQQAGNAFKSAALDC